MTGKRLVYEYDPVWAEYARKKFLLAELCDHDRRLYADVKAVALDGFFRRILGAPTSTL